MDLSIILVSYNVKDYLLGCLKSIYEQTSGIEFDVWVVDNASRDDTLAAVRAQYPQVRVVDNKKNVGLSAAVAQGVEVSSGRYVLYLNPDTEMIGDTLGDMVSFADSHLDAAGFACKLLNPDHTLQHSCFRFPSLRTAFYGFFPRVPMDSVENGRYPEDLYNQVFEPEHILGAFVMVRRDALEAIGGWDTSYFMYFEETDFCYRLVKAGFRILYNPACALIHYGGRSTSQVHEEMSVEFYRSQARYYRKNYGFWKYLQLKAIVALGLLYWALRSTRGVLRGRIDRALYRTRMRNYARILVM